MARHRESNPSKPDWSDWEGDPWLDPPPVPEAREGGESTWELWHEASKRLDIAFAPTEPSQRAPLDAPGEGSAGALSAAALMVLARRNNRVCPQPARWAELYQLLRGARHADLAPPPVHPGGWAKLSSMQKRLLFRDYVEWSERHRKLPELAAFMGALAESDWVHMDEPRSPPL